MIILSNKSNSESRNIGDSTTNTIKRIIYNVINIAFNLLFNQVDELIPYIWLLTIITVLLYLSFNASF